MKFGIVNIESIPNIEVDWEIQRGPGVLEHFGRSSVYTFLVCRDNKIPVSNTIDDFGHIVFTMPMDMPAGVWGLRAIWIKDEKDMLGGANALAKVMRCEVDNVLGVSHNPQEVTVHRDVKIKIKGQIASYGLDGLSAYEMAVINGKTSLSEDEWIDRENIGAEFSEQVKKQNVAISENKNKIVEVERTTLVTSNKTKQFGERVAENAGKISDIDAAVGVVDAKVTYLEEIIESEEKYHNKGVYRSEATLRNVCDNPETGDYCLLQEPYRYASDAEMPDTASASMYWGERYIGKKSDERFGYVYAGSIFFDDETSKSYYELTDNISAEAFAAHSIAELTTDHQAKNVLVRVLGYNERPKYYLQLCEDEGEWTNTYKEMTFDVANRVESKHVFEGSYTQEKINGVNQQNFIVVNNNNTRLQYVVNMLAKVVNNLQEKVAYLSEMTYENIPELNMVDLNASKTGSQYMLDFSPMEGDDVEFPFLLS